MSKVKWIIEDFAPENSFGKLAEEVRRQGMDCEVITYEPLQKGSFNKFGDEGCIIFQGSLEKAIDLDFEKKWMPGSWLTTGCYECTTYYAFLGKYLFNDPYILLPRREVLRKIQWLYEKAFGTEYNDLFIRPSSGTKLFSAGIAHRTDFNSFWTWVEEFSDPESMVVISSPKVILGEWRFVCAEHLILTGCQYWKDPSLRSAEGYPNEARELAERIAAEKFQPDPMFTIDICQGENNQFYLLEINSFSCSGLYACEMEPIVKKASEIALKQWEEIYGKESKIC